MLFAGYLAVLVPLVAVALAAVWVPRAWQAALVLSGPTVGVLAFAEVPLVDRLGWVSVIGIPYLYLVVLPAIPWRRAWARTAVPATVLLVTTVLFALAGVHIVSVVYLSPPIVIALVALGLAQANRRDRLRVVDGT